MLATVAIELSYTYSIFGLVNVMLSLCFQPGCRFGALGAPANAEAGKMCCICDCEFNGGDELSGQARGALVGKVLTLRGDPEIFDLAMGKLPTNIRSIIEKKIGTIKAILSFK